MNGLILNHLWQSTLFALAAALLALTLKHNSARVRYWLWLTASVKFLVPFAALTAAGSTLLASLMPPVAAPALLRLELVAQPFSTGTLTLSPLSAPGWNWMQFAAPALLALWAAGALAIMARWALLRFRLQRVVRQAVACPMEAPLPVKMAPSRLEPGLVGIWRPVILLPQGIAERLSAAELDAILAHEICHWRRRDNLLAALHMLVEALFWFHPLVWWLGARLNAERERACDEQVLASGLAPGIYATSILKVCQFYLHSPLDCAAGISGADLKRRMETIVENHLALRLNMAKKLLLAGCAILAIAAPVAAGLLASPPVLAQAVAPAPLPMPRLPRVAGTENSSSPGVELALRRLLDGRHDGKLPADLLSPELAALIRQGRSALGEHEYETRALGAVKSIAFQEVDQMGFDEYKVTYEHGRMTWLVGPLSDGKVDKLFWGEMLIDAPAHPGTEAAARRYLEMRVKNQPDYSQMTPLMVERLKQTPPQLAATLGKLGALKSLTFLGGSLRGSDAYDAVFENGTARVMVTLAADGKLELGDLVAMTADTPSATPGMREQMRIETRVQ